MKSVRKFSAAFEEEHGLSFLAARMLDIVKDMASSDFLSSNSLQTGQRCILVTKFLFQRSNILNISENIYGEERGSRTPGTSNRDDGALLLSWIEKEPLLVRAANQYVWNPVKNNPFQASFFYESGRGLLRELIPVPVTQHNQPPFLFRIPPESSFRSKTTTASMDQTFFNTMHLH